jgi:hypothetical protein
MEAKMRFIKKQLLVVAALSDHWWVSNRNTDRGRVSPTAIAVHKERQDYLGQQTTADNEDATTHTARPNTVAKHSKEGKAAVGPSVALPQDLLYDRRSRYWDQRVLRRLERMDEDDNDADAKDSKADKDDGDDEDFSIDKDKEDELERRREYWSKRLDDDW